MRHIYGVCHDEECPACEHRAEAIHDGADYSERQQDEFADQQAERDFENWIGRGWEE